MAEYAFKLECVEDEGNDRFLLRKMTKYLVTLKSIETVEMPKGPALQWTFVVMSGKKLINEETAKGLQVTHLTSQTLSPSTKLWKFIQDMLGRALTVGEEINPDDLLNKHYVVMINHHESKGKTYNQIAAISKFVPKK